jgi:glycolate dehydrogenase iron-sulfur subunit
MKSPLDDCVHCGFCLPACPTYVLWGQEADSPRGRIHLMRLEREGRGASPAAFAHHFDTCLGCMGCLTACPSGVRYDHLLAEARPLAAARATPSVSRRVLERVIFSLFPYPERLERVAVPLRWYQRSGLQRAVRRSGLLDWLPEGLRAMERLAPSATPALAPLPPRVAADGERRRTVGLLLGCVQRVFFGGVNAATARVLASEGCDVVVPPGQGCCGALSMHAGRREEARALARRTIDAFEQAGVDEVAINAAGCGSAMKEYGELLADDPDYAERARRFAARCRDVSEVLDALGPRAPRRETPLRVAYHDACHLQHAQRVRTQPRRLLASIPGVEVREVAEAELCCGSAGIYNLLQPGAARELRDRKVRNILATSADVVVSSNPGCLLQIADGLDAAGRTMRVAHLMELMDESITPSPRVPPDPFRD